MHSIKYFLLTNNKILYYIFTVYANRIILTDDINLEKFIMSKYELSSTNIKAIYTTLFKEN